MMDKLTKLTGDPDTVYQAHSAMLGDHITSVSLLQYLAIQQRQHSVLLSTQVRDRSHKDRLSEILQVLRAPRVSLTDAQATAALDPWLNWHHPITKANVEFCWSAYSVREKVVCYQFDGVSAADKKNLLPGEESILLDRLDRMGYSVFRLGKHYTLAEAARLLSTCAFFVGVDSGFSHLAHAVGCPVFLYERDVELATTHSLKQYVTFKSSDEFFYRAGHYLRLLGSR